MKRIADMTLDEARAYWVTSKCRTWFVNGVIVGMLISMAFAGAVKAGWIR